ncbi:Z1 domain-containing protein [Pantoea stewartii]|uniref:Z1 domain-containing protein n=1 Tax=Pantoea stewartii TaxID=66269 RepID=UPI0025A1BC19|nr:Z1 domain-containing protein [Pantoea stewartii]
MDSIKILDKVIPPLRWTPVTGDATQVFLKSKSASISGPTFDELTIGENSLLHEAMRILGRCLPPSDTSGSETGVVVGYVQSGKTMSFETVISLARDNGYGLVIVLVGTKKNLQKQSEDRLIKDLQIEDEDYWSHFSTSNNIQSEQVKGKILAWEKAPKRKKSIIITVLKQATHLENLHVLLKLLPLRRTKVPTLIIDDESDQASLNTLAAKIRVGEEAITAKSTIYEWIYKIRKALPHHSYLQYTATPQALLLMAQTDLLNPSFAEVITPGVAYTGGKDFFDKKNNDLIVTIPNIEVPNKDNEVTSIPPSLVCALKYFILVAGQHALEKNELKANGKKIKDRNRSMMVHPAMQTSSHELYKNWMDNALISLKRFISRSMKYNKIEEIEKYFEKEYFSLKKTYPGINDLHKLVFSIEEDVLNDLYCVKINGNPDAEKEVKWNSNPYWILVGGAKLDRGYTVEGLAITYMPRPLGTSPSADTLQQRARFFGYKKTYLGKCRVFLQEDVKDAFYEYVEHEEYVRSVLDRNRGEPLSKWRREFVLNEPLKPTRNNVIGIDTRRINISDWLVPKRLHRDRDSIKENQTLLNFVRKKWSNDYNLIKDAVTLLNKKNSSSKNEAITDIPLKVILDDFLLNLKVKDPQDAEVHGATLIALSVLLKADHDLKVDVFFINGLNSQYRTLTNNKSESVIEASSTINQYFSNSANSLNDRSFKSEKNITLQLRRFDLGTVTRDASSALIKNVVWYAVNIPEVLSKQILVEKR